MELLIPHAWGQVLNLDIVRKTSEKWNSVVSVWIYPKGCIFYNNIQYVPYF